MSKPCLTLVLIISNALIAASAHPGVAVGADVQQGRQLFERQWRARNPRLGGDGLGPQSNARSCIACHHQGGVGGSGDARFNAHAIAIEKMKIDIGPSSPGNVLEDVKRRLISSFYPGFVQSDGSIRNTTPLHHHGVSDSYRDLRQKLLSQTGASYSEQGGAADAGEASLATEGSIEFTNTVVNGPQGSARISIQARLFQRNTTPLFGAGLIDDITDEQIMKQAKAQRGHREISGRPSLLTDGTIGRFGWRANVSELVQFTDRACANELGLETRRRTQSIDPTRPRLRNSGVDIKDTQIESLSAFMAQLPRPVQQTPSDPHERRRVSRGFEVFQAVGCSVCHAPSVGSIDGFYSDMLLHDMGPGLYDYDAAEPYVVKRTLTREVIPDLSTATLTAYYGQSTPISGAGVLMIPTEFISPRGSTATTDFIPKSEGRELGRRRIGQFGGLTASVTMRGVTGVRRRLKPSPTSQEWRTPPLWGVADSAPYMHDGRAATLLEAISLHGGEASGTRDRYFSAELADRESLIAFLQTLVAPPTDRQSPPSHRWAASGITAGD